MPHSRLHHLDATAIAILLACCLFWGFQQVLVKATVAEVAPVFQAFVRFAMATLAVLAWCLWRGVRLAARRPRGLWRRGAGRGAVCGEFACIYIGLQYTTASRLTVFLYCSPFWVALLLPRFVPGEGLRGWQWLGLAGAFAGVGLALGEGLLGPAKAALPQAWLGDLLGLLAGLLWALTTVTIRATPLGRVAPAKQLLYQVGVSTAVLPLLSLALGERWAWISAPLPGLAAGAGAGGRVCQLPGVDVAAGALPGHQDFGVRVSHARIRPAVWRLVAGRARHTRPAGRAGAGGSRHCAGEPQARSCVIFKRNQPPTLVDKRNQLSNK
jgi:drug/metabolite transporter (DMT)-like permease